MSPETCQKRYSFQNRSNKTISTTQSQIISLLNSRKTFQSYELSNLPNRTKHYNSSRNLWRLESPTENPQWHCSPRCTNKRSISPYAQPLELNLIHQRPLLKSHSAKPSP